MEKNAFLELYCKKYGKKKRVDPLTKMSDLISEECKLQYSIQISRIVLQKFGLIEVNDRKSNIL